MKILTGILISAALFVDDVKPDKWHLLTVAAIVAIVYVGDCVRDRGRP